MEYNISNLRKGVITRIQTSLPYRLQEVFYWIWDNLNKKIAQNSSNSPYKLEQYQPICKDRERYCGIYLPNKDNDIIAYIDFQKQSRIICIGIYDDLLRKTNISGNVKMYPFPEWGSKKRVLKGLHVTAQDIDIVNILEGCYRLCMEEEFPILMRQYKKK